MTVLVIIPVLRRPHRAAPLAASLRAATPEPHRLLFVASPGDTDEHDACRATGADLLVIDQPPTIGDYAVKINTAYRQSAEPYLFLGADDLHFHPGWLPAALAKCSDRFGVVGTNDLGSPRVMAGEHATHSLVSRSYADLGTIDGSGILHEGYPHEFVDDELVGTAKHREAWAFAADSHVEHLHPNWGKAPMDGLYRKQAWRMRKGKRIFDQRRPLWT